MYRNSSEYDRLDKMVIEIYVDYGIKSFPLDEKKLCKNMGIEMIPYSSFETKERKLLKKRSLYGFCSLVPESYTPVIFYNDDLAELRSPATIKQTIRHEIKHVLDRDMEENLEDDDLAEHFGRYLAAPVPYLVAKKITNINVIISTFGVSATMAGYISSAVVNRIKKHAFLLSPDFSTYADMNLWRQIESVAKNRWCGAYWQSKGLTVVPTVGWSTPTSYDFCFDGIEKGSVVAVGMIGSKNNKTNFMRGYNAMLAKLEPETIICFGSPFKEMEGKIVHIDYRSSRKVVR